MLESEKKIFPEKLIETAAEKVFLLYGYHGATLANIASEANVSKSSIHYYFRSKENLYVQVLTNIYYFILTSDFTNPKNIQIIKSIVWFFNIEIYNNKKMLTQKMEKIYPEDSGNSIYYIKIWLKVVMAYLNNENF